MIEKLLAGLLANKALAGVVVAVITVVGVGVAVVITNNDSNRTEVEIATPPIQPTPSLSESDEEFRDGEVDNSPAERF